MDEIIKTISMYLGTDGFGYVYLAALIYLFCFEKKMRRSVVYPSLFITMVALNPLLYLWLYAKVFKYAYWRALWMLPMLPVIAIAFCSAIRRSQRQWVKLGVFFLMSAVVVLCGNNIYTTELGAYASFVRAENAYKLPQSVIHVADELLALSDEPSVLLPHELFNYIRQYSGKIHIMFGRYTGGAFAGKLVKEVATLDTDAPNLIFLHNKMKIGDIRYLVYKNKYVDESDMARCGFMNRSVVDGYGIYELDPELDFSQGNWQVNRYISDDGKRIVGYAVTSTTYDGRMVLIDCARADDKQALLKIIAQEDLKVSSWIITDPCSGSIDTLSEILAEYPEVSVESLRVFDGHDGSVQEDAVLAARSNLNVLRAGDEMNLYGLKLKVLHTGADDENASGETCARGVPVFKLSGGKRSILFCGDMNTQTAVSLLTNHCEELASTYVQMGDLESAGIGEKLCEVIAPEEVFIDVTGEMEDGVLSEEQERLASYLQENGAVCHTDTDTIHIMVL